MQGDNMNKQLRRTLGFKVTYCTKYHHHPLTVQTSAGRKSF